MAKGNSLTTHSPPTEKLHNTCMSNRAITILASWIVTILHSALFIWMWVEVVNKEHDDRSLHDTRCLWALMFLILISLASIYGAHTGTANCLSPFKWYLLLATIFAFILAIFLFIQAWRGSETDRVPSLILMCIFLLIGYLLMTAWKATADYIVELRIDGAKGLKTSRAVIQRQTVNLINKPPNDDNKSSVPAVKSAELDVEKAMHSVMYRKFFFVKPQLPTLSQQCDQMNKQ